MVILCELWLEIKDEWFFCVLCLFWLWFSCGEVVMLIGYLVENELCGGFMFIECVFGVEKVCEFYE